MKVAHRLGGVTLEVRVPGAGIVAVHRLAPAGAGAMVSSVEHRGALERSVLSAFTTARPCERKANRPPGPDALRAAAAILGPEGRPVTVDLTAYASLVGGAS